MSVVKRENLIWHTNFVQGATRKLLADVTDDEAFVTMGKSPNHICWQTGHLLTTGSHRLTVLGEKANIPVEWIRMFSRGSAHPGDRSAFPEFGKLRQTLFGIYEQADKIVANVTDEQLDSEFTLLPGWTDKVLHYVTFFLTHDFYHAGQIALHRRHLGRSGMFG